MIVCGFLAKKEVSAQKNCFLIKKYRNEPLSTDFENCRMVEDGRRLHSKTKNGKLKFMRRNFSLHTSKLNKIAGRMGL